MNRDAGARRPEAKHPEAIAAESDNRRQELQRARAVFSFVALSPLSMRDADDDEDTRVFSAIADVAAASPAGVSPAPPVRAAGLPPPRIDAQPSAGADDDESATRLMATPSATKPQKWLVSDGPNAPLDLSHNELYAALKSGKVSRAALAWQKGMREWQNVAEIPTLSSALPPRSSPRSSPPPKRSSRPRNTQPMNERPRSEAPKGPTLERVAPELSPKIETPDAATPPGGSVLLSASVSTADFSEITPAHTPHSQRTREQATESPLPQPERIELEPLLGLPARLNKPDKLSKPKASIHTPRPAAGRPPAPGDPVAKTPEAPDANVEPDAKVVINDPPAAVLATGLAQAKLNPTIETQRETTQPARWRPPLRQLRAAGQPPNVVLWVLGAGGWVLSGVLAGILIAKTDPEPPLHTSTNPVATHTALARAPGDEAPRSAAPRTTTPEAAAARPAEHAGTLAAMPESTAMPDQTATNSAPALQVPRPSKPALPKPSAVVAVKPALADPSGLSGPATTKDINTPGF